MSDHNMKRNRNHPRSPEKRREQRREQAIERQAIYDALPHSAKIQRAESRTKDGIGKSKRELARLQKVA